MNLKLTRHFQERLSQRGIDFDHVKQAIKSPDKKEDAFDGKIRVQKKMGTKTVEVIYYKDAFRDKKDNYILVTAYYLDNK